MFEKVLLAGMVVLLVAVIFGSCVLNYNCCRNAGFTSEQCVYQTACNGG